MQLGTIGLGRVSAYMTSRLSLDKHEIVERDKSEAASDLGGYVEKRETEKVGA